MLACIFHQQCACTYTKVTLQNTQIYVQIAAVIVLNGA